MKKLIVSALCLISASVMALTIPLGTTLSFTITADSVALNNVQYNPADGSWTLDGSLIIEAPTLTDNGVEGDIRVDSWCRVTVTSAEISAYAGLEPGVLPSEVLTGAQIDAAVTTIAMGKIIAHYQVAE